MNTNDDNFQQELLKSFKMEAEDHLKTLVKGLFSLEKKETTQQKDDLLQEMFRAAHSLKGSARAVNCVEVIPLCQIVEETFSFLKKGNIEITKELVSVLSDSFDALEKLIFLDKQVLFNENFTTDPLLDSLQGFLERRSEGSKDEVREKKKINTNSKKLTENRRSKFSRKIVRKQDTIRVSTNKIDNLMQNVEEMLTIKMGLCEKLRVVREIFSQLRDLLERKISNRHLAEDDFYNDLQLFIKRGLRLSCVWEQDSKVVGNMIDNVLESSKEILLEPISTILDKFPKIAHDLSRSLEKEIKLTIIGDEIEVDRRILENLNDPLIHVVRNCIDHGIEDPSNREKKGKTRDGTITIHASYEEGNKFRLLITDDGAGVDFDKVRKKIVEDGLSSQKNVDNMNDQEILIYLFRAGFTTSDIVTEISGRGIGMDVLAENVEKLGGSIKFNSTVDVGTTISIMMPLTMATFRGIQVFTGEQEFILPTERVVRVVRIPSTEIKSVEGNRIVVISQVSYPYMHLATLLDFPKVEDDKKNISIVLIKAQEITIAIGVDSIIKEDEVYIKPLSYPLVRVKNIAAATIQESGKIVPVLNPFDLVKKAAFGQSDIYRHKSCAKNKSSEKKSILLVEDSSTTRMLLKNILESSKFNVRIAVNGSDALKVLNENMFDLILSDVEMPLLDGFKLTETVKNSDKWKNIPVVLCTSRGSKEDRKHGIEVGANAYIDKSSFSQNALIEIIDQLICR